MRNFLYFDVRSLEELRIKNLEHWIFCCLQLSHLSGSNLILLSTSFTLAGLNRLVRLCTCVAYIEDEKWRICHRTLSR